MLNLGTATPAYQGNGEPAPGSGGGILGALTALFGGGGSTPAYAGNGQPSSGSGGFLGSATPAYQPAPPAPTTQPPPNAVDAVAPCPEPDPDPFGSGPFAIVIQRDS